MYRTYSNYNGYENIKQSQSSNVWLHNYITLMIKSRKYMYQEKREREREREREYICAVPCQTLDGTHLILCQQTEHYTFPAIPKNNHHREISFINTQIDYNLDEILIYILHLNATIFTKLTMYNRKHYIHSCS